MVAVLSIARVVPSSITTSTVVLFGKRQWSVPKPSPTPTETVALTPCSLLGIATLATVLKAFVPAIAVLLPSTNLKLSVMMRPSTLVPVIVSKPLPRSATVPPGFTTKVLGTSGSVIPEVIV